MKQIDQPPTEIEVAEVIDQLSCLPTLRNTVRRLAFQRDRLMDNRLKIADDWRKSSLVNQQRVERLLAIVAKLRKDAKQ